MKKNIQKIITFALSAIIAFSLISCNRDNEQPAPPTNEHGSVVCIDIYSPPSYQLLFVTPGISPREAFSRKWTFNRCPYSS